MSIASPFKSPKIKIISGRSSLNNELLVLEKEQCKHVYKPHVDIVNLLTALSLLTRCPNPILLWCAAWRPSNGHEWGGQPAPASSGPRFHSSRAKAGGTNPPHFSGGLEKGRKGEGWKRNEKNNSQRQWMKGKFIIGWRQNEDDSRKGTDKEIKIYSCVNAATQKHKWKHEKWRNAH